jgi:hypothetical protein
MLPPRTELYKESLKVFSNAIDLIIEQSNKTEIYAADDNLQKVSLQQ